MKKTDKVWEKLNAAEQRVARAQNELARFIEQNESIFDTFVALQQEETAALEQAKSLYSENLATAGARWGGFETQNRREFNAVVLYENLDDEVASRLLETKLVVSAAKFDEAVANGDIPDVLAKLAVIPKVTITSPKTVMASRAIGKKMK